MAWSLLDDGVARFTDGNSGHVYTYPDGAPSPGDLLVLGVNSDTIVSTPSGWTLAVSAVASQGAYVFVRLAGASEPSSATVTSSGNYNVALSYRRYSGALSATPERTAAAQINGSLGFASPSVSPAALSGTSRLCLLYAMNHSASTAPASPLASSGYAVAADTGVQGSSGPQAAEHLVLQRIDGSGSETPSVTWSDNGSNAFADRYALFVAFMPATASETTGTGAASLGGFTASASAVRTVTGTGSASLGGLTGTASGTRAVSGVLTAALGLLAAAITGVVDVPGIGAASLGGLTASGVGTRATAGTASATLGAITATAVGANTPASTRTGHRPVTELVAKAWLTSLTGITAGMVGTTLPQDTTTWDDTGFIQVSGVSGQIDPYTGLRRPHVQIDCWAIPPGSAKPPWMRALQLAETINAACIDGAGQQTTVQPGPGYDTARVLTVHALGEPRRLPGDEGAYARYTFDLEIVWVRTTREA